MSSSDKVYHQVVGNLALLIKHMIRYIDEVSNACDAKFISLMRARE